MLELEGNIGILYRVLFLQFSGYGTHGQLSFPFFANEGIYGNRGISQIGLREQIHIMTHIWIEQIVGNHGIKELPMNFNSVIGQYLQVILKVLSYLENRCRFKKGF